VNIYLPLKSLYLPPAQITVQGTLNKIPYLLLCCVLQFFPLILSAKNCGREEVTLQMHRELTHVLCRYFPEYIFTYIFVHTYTDMHCVMVLDRLHTKLLE